VLNYILSLGFIMQKTLLRGTLNILPLAISVWLCWSITVALDDMGHAILTLIGLDNQLMGSGFIFIFGLLLMAGVAFSVSPIIWLYQKLEKQILRFPFFRTIYSSLKDLASLASSDESTIKKRQTVLFKQSNGAYIVGFVTSESIPQVVSDALPEENSEWVPVLIQMSYQVAGVTSLVKRSDLIYVDWPFEDAMRFMLTAGISPNNQN
jgi:uncharacterized membrane protein